MKKDMPNLDDIDMSYFRSLPLVVEGESKEIRYLGNGLCLQYFKPTIYSFSKNRCGVVEGSNSPRLRVTKIFTELLHKYGIDHSYLKIGKKFVLAKMLIQEPTGILPNPFVPDDMTPNEIEHIKRVPPIEVVIKRFHTGTTKHEMYGMINSQIRENHYMFPKMKISADEPYPMPIIRFDWRNPLLDKDGNRLADKALSSDMANFFIDVEKTTFNAKKAYHVIADFLAYCDIVCYDICLFFTTDGETMYGEISPDCGRFRHFSLGSLDKDLWRAGGSSEEVLKKWNLMADIIEDKWESYKQTISHDVGKINYSNKKIYLGTSNPYKVSEILSELSPYAKNIRLAPEDDTIIEDGKTFVENACIKAKAYARLANGITIAEDSGLVIPLLNNMPGVYSARFSLATLNNRSLRVMEIDKTDLSRDDIDSNNRLFVIQLINDVLKKYPTADLSAYFICAIAVSDGGNILFTCEGRSDGKIITDQRGNNGFGYDKIFEGIDTDGLTYAELDPYRKMLRSHRTKALKKLRTFLEKEIF